MRWIDTDVDRARWRSTVTYRIVHRFQAGAEWNLGADEVTPIATLFLLHETDRAPAVFAGTSSDRIGSPKGTQSYSLTAAKAIPDFPVSVYGTVMYSQWEDRLNYPFGGDIFLPGGFSVRPMYDGHRSHLTASYSTGRWSATLMWIWLEKPGVSISVGF